MVSALDRKLLRDLVHLKGQVVTVALVVACGVAGFVAFQSTWESLERSKRSYYERYRFAHAFVSLKRAPEGVARRLEAIPGVALVHTRVVQTVNLPLPGLPATGDDDLGSGSGESTRQISTEARAASGDQHPAAIERHALIASWARWARRTACSRPRR